MESIFYSLINPKNVDQKIINGYQTLFPHRYTQEAFNWEFVQVNGRGINVIAQDNQKEDKLICTQGHIPIGLKKGNQPYISHKTVGNYLLPEYRGASIFTDLYKIGIEECVKENSRLIWGFTPAVKVWRDKVGFKAVEKEIFEGKLYLPSKFHSKGQGMVGALKSIYTSLKKSIYKAILKPNTKKITVKDLSTCMKDFETFYNDCFTVQDQLLHINLSAEYLNWRVFTNPNNNYKSRLVYFENKVIGYYIYAIKDNANLIYLSEITSNSAHHYTLVFESLLLELMDADITSITYFGNLKNELNKQIFKLFTNFKGEIKLLDWATFVMMDTNGDSIVPNHAIENIYINGLWTEGYTY